MRSMTGFGKSSAENQEHQVEVEIKSVNHRFLDIQIRSPKGVNEYENEIRQTIKQSLNRGRVEVFITLTELSDSGKEVQVHWHLIDGLVKELRSGAVEKYGASELSPDEIIRQLIPLADFIEVRQTDSEDAELQELVLTAVQAAAEKNAISRLKEGEGIKAVLADNQAALTQQIAELTSFTEVYEADHRQKFQKKLEDYLGENVDQDRLLTEMAILLERGDIHEEIDRMGIHLEKMTALLTKEEPVGRELDFLIQEMNREVNTIGSKSTPIEIKELVVQMKTIIEKIREQVQNIE